MPDVKCVLIHDNFQNFKSYNIPKAQLVIADIPYNIGTDFYASRPDWYVDGDNKNGESSKARKAAFNTDFTFNIAEYFHFCNRLLKKEPGTGEKDAPCMIVFCAFQQIPKVITEAEKYGFKNYIPLVFCKNYSPQVLKANMKIVGATEYALVLYRGKLPKFRNLGEDGKSHMIFNWFDWKRDGKEYPKIHPSQKPISVMKRLIETSLTPAMWSLTRALVAARPFVQHESWGATAMDLKYPEIFTRKPRSRCSERRMADEHRTE